MKNETTPRTQVPKVTPTMPREAEAMAMTWWLRFDSIR